MAQDYVVLNEKNENGLIAINKTVFKSIAEISIDDIENAIRVPQARFTKPLTVKELPLSNQQTKQVNSR